MCYDQKVKIKGGEKLTEVFGRWPSFHDAEVLRLHFERVASGEGHGPTVECTIHVWEMTNEVDEKGYFVLKNHVLTTFRFVEVSESTFNGFNHQNVLWALEIQDISSRQLERIKYCVTFPTSYGLEGSLKCLDVEVLEVIACNPSGFAKTANICSPSQSPPKRVPDR